MTRFSRRAFLGGALACGCAGPATAALAGTLASLKTPDYAAVQLGDGRMRDQFRHQHALFRDFDNDKLLKPLRSRAGLAAPCARSGPDTWTAKTAATQVTLKPFMAVGAETYRVYNCLLS